MPLQQAGRKVVARIALLLCLTSFGTPLIYSQVVVRGPRLFEGDAPYILRGVVYAPTPIGRRGSAELSGASCLYSRDLPLIAAMGANAIRTVARVDPADQAFRRALDDAGLYWLAGFPLDPYYDPARSLDPQAPGGAELRGRIVGDFVEYARSWAGEPRLAALVFGDDVGRNYETKLSGERRHYYSLLAEAAARVYDAGLPVAVAASVPQASEIGAFNLGTSDSQQPDLALWMLERSGTASIGPAVQQARGRTAKALALSGFGVDAYDQHSRSANPEQQGEIAKTLAAEVAFHERSQTSLLSGSFWNGYVDEWWRGGPAGVHGSDGETRVGARTATGIPAGAGSSERYGPASRTSMPSSRARPTLRSRRLGRDARRWS